MKNLALGALLAGFLAACGGGDDDIQIDAAGGGDAGIDAPIALACNPLAAPGAQGCATGEKCTWIDVVDNAPPADDIGKLGCVPDGTVDFGGACLIGAAGETTGFDNCKAGNYCIDRVCRDVCGFDNAAGAACATGFNCTRYADTFSNGDEDPSAGICKESCDPLTQTITGGGTCGAMQGCYLLSDATHSYAVCASAGTLTHGQAIPPPVSANSCAPKHTFRASAQGATTLECTSFCKPADVTSTTNMASEGGVFPDNCASAGAAPPESGSAGEYCQYYWIRERFNNLSPFSNTIGTCFKHAIYQYDSDGNMMVDSPWPRCITLTTGDVIPPFGTPAMPGNDALGFACIQLPPALQGFVKASKHYYSDVIPHLDRLSRVR